MAKGRYAKKRTKKFPVWLILILVAAIAAIFAAILFLGKGKEDIPFETESPVAQQTESVAQTENREDTEAPTEPQQTEVEIQPSESEAATEPLQTEAPETIPPQPTVVIVQKAEAEYEKWLSAAMLVCVSMEYPDFELEAIYAASATSLDDKLDSAGAYIVFNTEGKRVVIHSKALTAERTASGTMDISTEIIGYASFDRVDPASVDFSGMEKIELDKLSELIEQSLLISIYAR